MSLEERDKIAKQMYEYDRIGEQWVPYLMRSDSAYKSFDSVNTDKWGLRNTIGNNNTVITVDSLIKNTQEKPVGVVLGSSSVFGVGATNDKYTIPSYLNSMTDALWLNFGGRAYNSTQEVIKLMLHLPQKLDYLVVFSGVNNITLSFLSDSTSPVYNSFFGQSVFERAMKDPPDMHIGVRKAIKILIKEIRFRLFGNNELGVRKSIDDSYHNILLCFERDLHVLNSIAKGLGTRLIFVLQPLATWIDKELAHEEDEIFRILDSMSGDWKILSESIKEIKSIYFEDLNTICKRVDVPFLNMNESPEFNKSDWIFVDRVHLTDKGYELAASIIKERFLYEISI